VGQCEARLRCNPSALPTSLNNDLSRIGDDGTRDSLRGRRQPDKSTPRDAHRRAAGAFKPATVYQRHRALALFFKCLAEEDVVRESPMRRMKPPSVPETPRPGLSESNLRKLLAACEGTSTRSISQLARQYWRRPEPAGRPSMPSFETSPPHHTRSLGHDQGRQSGRLPPRQSLLACEDELRSLG
jgi:hypothetical protein